MSEQMSNDEQLRGKSKKAVRRLISDCMGALSFIYKHKFSVLGLIALLAILFVCYSKGIFTDHDEIIWEDSVDVRNMEGLK